MTSVYSMVIVVVFSLILTGCAALQRRALAPRPISPAAHAPRPASGYDWTALTAQLQTYVPDTVPGLGLMISRDGQTLYSQAFGNQTVDTVLLIASSTKMPTAAAVLTLVDSGQLDLDQPVGTYLSGHITWPADKAAITTRMLLNHTSGLPNNAPCLSNRFTTLRECAQSIANQPLAFAPGTQFDYGNSGFQVAGYVAEVLSGQTWAAFFATRLATPLGLTRFTYGNSANPLLAGGARSDMGDYMRFLEMGLQEGVFNGQRVLSPTLVAEMQANQTAGLPTLTNPGMGFSTGYSFGWWHSNPSLHPNSAGPELSDPGLFGSTPWIDLDLGYAAHLLIYDNTATGLLIWNQIRPLITEQLLNNPTVATPTPLPSLTPTPPATTTPVYEQRLFLPLIYR